MSDDRLLDAFKAVVLSLLPNYTYLGFHRYVVSSWSAADQTFDGKPLDPSKGLPDVTKVPARTPGIATIKLSDSETVLIGFEDADPTKPFVASFGYPTGTSLPIGRQGDLVSTGVTLIDLATVMTAAAAAAVPTDGGKVAFTTAALALQNCAALTFTNPPPPPYVTGIGGPATLVGVVSSGSQRNKSL